MLINVEQQNLGLICGLIFACPMGNEAENCPFRSIRKLPVETRLSLLERLPRLDQEVLFMHHRKCLDTKDICTRKEYTSNVCVNSITAIITA